MSRKIVNATGKIIKWFNAIDCSNIAFLDYKRFIDPKIFDEILDVMENEGLIISNNEEGILLKYSLFE